MSVAGPLDPGAPVALYAQLAGDLLARIERGDLAGRLPSVVELAAAYGVARGTANKALRLLASSGHATLVRGRGYYVTSSDPIIATTATGSTMPA